MDLVVAGSYNKVIAYDLGISPKTVELHRARIMTKMEAPTLTHLVRMAVSGQVEEA
ncbi:Transcriptional regulatory protein FixJ [compost metagenome]